MARNARLLRPSAVPVPLRQNQHFPRPSFRLGRLKVGADGFPSRRRDASGGTAASRPPQMSYASKAQLTPKYGDFGTQKRPRCADHISVPRQLLSSNPRGSQLGTLCPAGVERPYDSSACPPSQF